MATIEYASMPTTLNEAQVRDVAARQRAVMYCILAYLGLVVVTVLTPPSARPLVGGAYLVVAVVAAVCFVRLAIKFYHPVMAVLMMIAMLIPLLNLLVLLSVNGRATQLLRRNGIRVGLLGARV